MRVVLPIYLERLKQQILKEAGIKSIVPADCSRLAADITARVKTPISDTTLKRIYGFAANSCCPSLFTLNTLATYCGYKDWAYFCDRDQADTGVTVPSAGNLLSASRLARKISQRTLEMLTGISGLPYHLTVTRSFMKEHLDFFADSDQTATLFTAPAGYGKTIGVCHWVEEKMNQLVADNSEDIVLFLSSRVLPGIQRGDNSISDWLKTLMGFTDEHSDLAHKIDDHLQERGMFYLVIDGFDREKFKTGDYDLLTDLLLDIIALYRHHPGFKLILTMRSSTWTSFYNRLTIGNMAEAWFLGFMQNSGIENNMLLLDHAEMLSVCRRIKPNVAISTIRPEVLSFFSYPLFLQYYYQKHSGGFCLENLGYVGTYEVVSNYFLDVIYTGRYATEKIILLDSLAGKVQLHDGDFSVPKLKVYEELKEFREAYNELLAIGFLVEVNQSKEGKFAFDVKFAHKKLLNYCLARKLVYDGNELYDQLLMERIGLLNEGNRVSVLKWCVFNAAKVNQLSIFDHLARVSLTPVEKSYFIKFLASLIRQPYLPGDETCPQDIGYYLGVEFIAPEYEPILQCLLNLELDNTEKIWVNTALGMLYMVQLNSVGAELCIARLRGLPNEVYQPLPINPMHCLETLYYYLKFGIVKQAALKEITTFCFNPPLLQEDALRTPDQLLYLLALSTLGLCGNKAKLLRFVKVLQRMTAADSNNAHSAFRFFLMITEADSHLSLGNITVGQSTYASLKSAFEGNEKHYTPYMKICLQLVRAKVLATTGNGQEAQLVIEQVMAASVPGKYHYIEVNVIAAYLAMQPADYSSDFLRHIYFRLTKVIRTSGFDPRNFLLHSKYSVPQRHESAGSGRFGHGHGEPPAICNGADEDE